MNWRLASRLSVITLAILVVILVTLIQRYESGASNTTGSTTTNTSGLVGTDLGGKTAPDFRLTDQFGKAVALSDFKGKPVILTFLYTHCPDECPLTAEKLHTTMLKLGSNAQKVAVLAVSTDPKGDTIASALNFSNVHSMTSYWHYLVGTQQVLTTVWSNYSVYAQAYQQSVNHSLATYIIDSQGLERVLLDNTFTPDQMVANMQQLLKA